MKKQTQRSLLKWASLLSNRPITSLNDIQSPNNLILLLNKIQRLAFQQLYHIDQRASNSASTILKSLNSYYKKQLKCNVNQLLDGLNIFKNPIMLWELLIGVAIRGKNRDANINIILQMEAEQQAELMLLVEEVIEKLGQYDLPQDQLNESHVSDSSESGSIRQRKPSQQQFSTLNNNNKRVEFLNQLIQQNQLLKDKNIELLNEVSQLKSSNQQLKKTYEDRLNHFKSQRYQFLQVLQGGSSGIQISMRSRRKSQLLFSRQSSISGSQSKIFDDPLHELNIQITGSLADIAADMLSAVKNLKKQSQIYMEKASLLEDHNKDLKISLNQMAAENKHLKDECLKVIDMEKDMQMLRGENQELIRNETELLRMMNEVQQQKQYLKGQVQKLREEKSVLIQGGRKGNNNQLFSVTEGQGKRANNDDRIKENNNTLDPQSPNSNKKIDLIKAPSFILRQMSSQLEPESYNLNQELDDIKNPALKDKYQKQIDQLKQKNDKQVEELKEKIMELRKQNNELKQMNKMLQKTIMKSMEKTDEIQKNIEDGYRALFGIRESVIESSIEQKNEEVRKQLSESTVSIKLLGVNNIWTEGDNKQEQQLNTQRKDQQNSKIIQFYDQVKKAVQSYEQKQLLMMIEIQSLKKQLHDVLAQRNSGNLNKNSYKMNRMAITPNEQYNYKKSQISQFEQNPLKVEKKESVLMFNIKVSGPGGEKPLQLQNQQYQVRKSQIRSVSPKNQSQHDQPQTCSPKTKLNRQLDPSQGFIQIQQGQQLNQNQFPNIAYGRKSQLNSIRGSIDQRIADDMSNKFVKKSSYEEGVGNIEGGMLDVNMGNNHQMNRLSTISGIDLRFSKDQRRSFFAKSGFYNESFIELSHKLQSQIQQDLNEISHVIQQKTTSNKHKSKLLKPQTTSSYPVEQQQHNHHNQQQPTKLQDQNKALVQKLQKIKSSYSKIKQFHTTSAEQIQSQLKDQLTFQKSQLAKLQVYNESLKQALTLMLAQKQVILSQVKHLKLSIQKVNSKQQLEELMRKFTQMFSSIQDLQHILPQLETRLDDSRTKKLEILYAKEKYQRQKLEEQICVMMETILWFRNLAVDEQF